MYSSLYFRNTIIVLYKYNCAMLHDIVNIKLNYINIYIIFCINKLGMNPLLLLKE